MHFNFAMINTSIVAYWRHMRTYICVNIGSGNALLSDGTRSLPERMLT